MIIKIRFKGNGCNEYRDEAKDKTAGGLEKLNRTADVIGWWKCGVPT